MNGTLWTVASVAAGYLLVRFLDAYLGLTELAEAVASWLRSTTGLDPRLAGGGV